MRPFLLLFILLWATWPAAVQGQEPRVGREAALAMDFEELDFDPPRARSLTLSTGPRVIFLEDHALPLVTVYARFRGGYSLLPRRYYAAATALPGLVRAGGTSSLSPDSVDFLLDYYALQTTFGGGGEGNFSSLNTLTRHLGPALELWGDMVKNPAFDQRELDVWRGRQEENIRRRGDDPGRLAFSEFNHIMFGDHPVGWEMNREDLGPERLNRETMEEVHGRIFCPGNLVLGVVGDVTWAEIRPLLEDLTRNWEPCGEPLDPLPIPEMRREGKVFLIPRDISQSTVVLAEPGGVRQGSDPDYFASRIGNSILGAGGFTSRLVTRVRTEEGYAYSASSLWTTPSSYEGIVGAVTRTKSGSTVAAIELILETMEEMRRSPPRQDEVDRTVAQIVNGFVFNFQDPSQIVARQMFYLAQDLPDDWLVRYLEGIQRVTPERVRQVFRRHLHPDRMTILVVGNPDAFDRPLETLGEVEVWEVEGMGVVREPDPGSPRGERRSPR
jgi:predicted Zn-dependent peptidase